MTRRDKCYLVGKRAALLSPEQRSAAWESLAIQIEAMGELDLPKYEHLILAIRAATIKGREVKSGTPSQKGNMNLDRNIDAKGRGKYALVNMRKLIPLMDGLAEANRTTNPDKLPNDETLQLLEAFDLLLKAGIISLGNEKPGDQFFVMKYKDKFTAPALEAYAKAVRRHAELTGSQSLHEYASAMFWEAASAQLGTRIPD